VLLAVTVAACERRVDSVTETGQWISSATDSALFVDASRSIPALVPTVWIGTIRASKDGTVQVEPALSPGIAGRARTGVVIRFDNSFTNSWSTHTDSAVADEVTSVLRDLLSAADSAGVTVSEVQLDYACPERLLRRWSAVVADLSVGALIGRTVWLTSRIAHMRHREYGDLFRDNVRGHILQVFEGGERMSLPYARQIERLASRQRMPFRLGVAAVERRPTNGSTRDHETWFEAPHIMRGSRWYRGLWVLPGGMPWVQLLESTK
jgi:hypothetical protein